MDNITENINIHINKNFAESIRIITYSRSKVKPMLSFTIYEILQLYLNNILAENIISNITWNTFDILEKQYKNPHITISPISTK
jgi:hypothetical protein